MTIRFVIFSLMFFWCAGCQAPPTRNTSNGGGPAKNGQVVLPNGNGGQNNGNGNSDPLVVAPSPSPDKMDMEILWGNFYWDEDPYPDGVMVKLRLWRVDRPLAFALTQGLIEFILYEGAIDDEALADTPPFHVWRYTARGLNKAGGKKVIVGWQHELQLDWGDNVPKKDYITLSARVVRPGKAPLYAKPAKIRLYNK